MIDLAEIPDALKEGENWPLLDLDPDWVWTHSTDGVIDGMLIAAPCHGIAFLWRLKILPTAPRTALLSLLRACLHDLRARGYLGFLLAADVERETEKRLARIALKAGATIVSAATMICGSVEQACQR